MAESQFIEQGMGGGGANAKSPAPSVFAWEAAAATKKDKMPAAGRTYAAVTAAGKKKTAATTTTTAKAAKLGAYVDYGDEGGGGVAEKQLVTAMPTTPPSPAVGYVMMETKRGAAGATPPPPVVSVFPTLKKKSVLKKRPKTDAYISLAPKKASSLPKRTPSQKSKQSKKSLKSKTRTTAAKTRVGAGPSFVSAVKQGPSEVLWPTKMKKAASESLGYKIIKTQLDKDGQSVAKNMEPTKRYLLMTTTAPEPPTQVVPQPTVQIEEPDLQKTASASDVHFASNAEKTALPPPKSTVFSLIDRLKKPKASVFSIIPAKKNQETVFDEIERRPEGPSKKAHHLKKSCRILIIVLVTVTIAAAIFVIYLGVTKFAPATASGAKINDTGEFTASTRVKMSLKSTNQSVVAISRTTSAKTKSKTG